MRFYILITFLLLGNIMASNYLSSSTSPYLLQHKDNPVDWYPWGDEAFTKAKKENKLIFLSIGYSTCHWCHVMAHESFEDKRIADILNKYFISIKVDKEQHPHIDNYYQNIYRIMNNRSGGWPLTIMLTPNKKPFFSATYIPKDEGYGSNGLKKILLQISQIPLSKLEQKGDEILNYVENQNNQNQKTIKIDTKLEDKTIKQFKSYYDTNYQGFSIRPKFPHATNITLLLKLYKITKDKDALAMAIEPLKSMANGGIYDQIEGGFYRYCVDKKWEIPHFEKMLYTNGELLESYTKGYQITKNKLFKEVVDKTIKQIDKRFMIDNVYQSASNADSKNFNNKNEEGFYFIYDYDTTYEFLEKHKIDEERIEKSLKYLGILEDGNIDGESSNPHITNSNKPDKIDEIIQLLTKIREQKEYPFIDSKINTAWNSLYIKGKFIAGDIDSKYIKEAVVSLDKLLDLLYIDGILYHQTILGKKSTQKALLEDYSFLSSCLFEAYQKTLDKKYFKLFKILSKESIAKFYKNNRWQESDDGFVTYAKIRENGYASALGVNLVNLLLYATVEANFKVYQVVQKTLAQFSQKINDNPSYYPDATIAQIMTKTEPIFIKSKVKNLNIVNINSIRYPFIYISSNNEDNYLACKLNSCFSFSKDFNKIKFDIESIK